MAEKRMGGRGSTRDPRTGKEYPKGLSVEEQRKAERAAQSAQQAARGAAGGAKNLANEDPSGYEMSPDLQKTLVDSKFLEPPDLTNEEREEIIREFIQRDQNDIVSSIQGTMGEMGVESGQLQVDRVNVRGGTGKNGEHLNIVEMNGYTEVNSEKLGISLDDDKMLGHHYDVPVAFVHTLEYSDGGELVGQSTKLGVRRTYNNEFIEAESLEHVRWLEEQDRVEDYYSSSNL